MRKSIVARSGAVAVVFTAALVGVNCSSNEGDSSGAGAAGGPTTGAGDSGGMATGGSTSGGSTLGGASTGGATAGGASAGGAPAGGANSGGTGGGSSGGTGSGLAGMAGTAGSAGSPAGGGAGGSGGTAAADPTYRISAFRDALADSWSGVWTEANGTLQCEFLQEGLKLRVDGTIGEPVLCTTDGYAEMIVPGAVPRGGFPQPSAALRPYYDFEILDELLCATTTETSGAFCQVQTTFPAEDGKLEVALNCRDDFESSGVTAVFDPAICQGYDRGFKECTGSPALNCAAVDTLSCGWLSPDCDRPFACKNFDRCAFLGQVDCTAQDGCQWQAGLGECVTVTPTTDCDAITDIATCFSSGCADGTQCTGTVDCADLDEINCEYSPCTPVFE